jgi:hypothetical protein
MTRSDPSRSAHFLSVVVVLRDRADRLRDTIGAIARVAAPLAPDYEIVIVDNGSTDDSARALADLTGPAGLPNLQVFALSAEADWDTAAWLGLDNAIGDFVAVIDPTSDSIDALPAMLAAALAGHDIVLARNREAPPSSLPYRAARALFVRAYRALSGVDLRADSLSFGLYAKRVVTFVLQQAMPAVAYRYISVTSGFRRTTIDYVAPPMLPGYRRLRGNAERGMRLLMSTTAAPLRIATWLLAFGAVANALYSCYVVAVALLKSDVAPGWTTLSLQQSGMFLLFSIVLLILGEYVLHLADRERSGARSHVAQELTSEVMLSRGKLNVADAAGTACADGQRA